MNRIYQGRVTKVETLKSGANGTSEEDWLPLNNWEDALWQHHKMFQDAVNYYIMALLALADPNDSENFIVPIRNRLAEQNLDGKPSTRQVWHSFRRKGETRPGMQDSVNRSIRCYKPNSSPMDFFEEILKGNTTNPSILNKTLIQLLKACEGGGGKIRNAAPEFHPLFCNPDTNANFKEDRALMKRDYDRKVLPFLLHSDGRKYYDSIWESFDVFSIATPNKKNPKLPRTKALDLLANKALKLLIEEGLIPKSKARHLKELINGKPEDFIIPGYIGSSAKGRVKTQLYALLLFKYVESSPLTFEALKKSFPPPNSSEKRPQDIDFSKLPDDPIKVSRGLRGYVFKAFTALEFWETDGSLKPSWGKFDFSAFEEALKSLHQVDEKTKERKKEADKLSYRKKCMLNEEVWQSKGENEESAPPMLKGDPRFDRLIDLLKTDLSQEYEIAEGQSIDYGLHPRTIRGFLQLRKRWRQGCPAGEAYSDTKKESLLSILRKHQRDHPGTMGSSLLFEALLEQDNWMIWQEPTSEEKAQWRKTAKLKWDADYSSNPLQALTELRLLERDIERLKEPISFTPADPVYSRRQFYFSDVIDLTKRERLHHDRQTLKAEIAFQKNGKWEQKQIRIHFSAPRLLRDKLNNIDGADAAWQQAMMAALDLKTGLTKKGKPTTFADCAAVALMPEVSASGKRRILLNFPVTLDGEDIANQLGKTTRWDFSQFGSADGQSYWLRWPSTWIDDKRKRKNAPQKPWWKRCEPFHVLSVDLGQRVAGAFALLEATPGDAPKKHSRKLGMAEGVSWWATLRTMGMLKLPGENALVIRDRKWQEEFSGNRGRMSTRCEWEEAQKICEKLNFDPGEILNTDPNRYSFPEQNDQLLYALRRAQAKLARWQSWSCIAHKEIKEQRCKNIIKEINVADDDPLNLKPLLKANQLERVSVTLCNEIKKYRKVLKDQLVRIANRIQPLRGKHWEWVLRSDDNNCHVLRQTERGCDDRKKKLAGQRGLSLKRIEQLESLRQRCQSLNRALMQTPGKPAKLGFVKRGIELPDPCPELLERLSAIKEQRVNQTANLILAQALGVRLKTHTKDKVDRTICDIHGEYERIPGRKPVDFLVLEDLSRYSSSQGRSRAENSRLMKWCHRAILAKLKQLCEPYGLRVLEAPAAYSSRFCSLTSVAGFRAIELSPDKRGLYPWKKILDRVANPERANWLSHAKLRENESVKQIFDNLEKVNADFLRNRPHRPKWRTLFAPIAGGPIFASALRKLIQADINAAINIGLRAIASPEAEDIHVRLRVKRAEGKLLVRVENKREKARWKNNLPEIHFKNEVEGAKAPKETYLNFFVDRGEVAKFDKATLRGCSDPIASGRGVWGSLDQDAWKIINCLNNDRLEKWGYGRPLDESEMTSLKTGINDSQNDDLSW